MGPGGEEFDHLNNRTNKRLAFVAVVVIVFGVIYHTEVTAVTRNG